MWDLTDAWPNPLYFGLVGPLSALLLACVYQNRGSRWLAWLRSDALRTLGVLSYGTYVWHMAGGRMVNIRLASAPAEPVLLLQIAVLIWYLGLVIGTAAVTYRFVERPALQLKDRWFGGHHRSSSGWSARWLPALLISVGAVCIAEAVFRLI